MFQRFSARNSLAWISGSVGVLALFAVKVWAFDATFGLVILGCGLIGVAYLVITKVAAHRHGHAVKEFAARNGWTYSAHGYGQAVGLTGFPFDAGSFRRCEDVIEGRYGGMDCASYTYVFAHNYGDGKEVEQVFTVTQTRVDPKLPRLDLVPEDVGSRLLGGFIGNDIDLESAEFNRTWRVLSPDRRYAIDVVTPRMMEALLRQHTPGLAVRIENHTVLAWSAGRAGVDELSRRLDLVTGVARRLPPHVVRHFDEAEQQRRALEAEREANAPQWAREGGILNSRQYTGIEDDDSAVR